MNKMVLEALVVPALLFTEYLFCYTNPSTNHSIGIVVGIVWFVFLGFNTKEYATMLYGITSSLIIFGIMVIEGSAHPYSIGLYWVVTIALVGYTSQLDNRLPALFYLGRYMLGALFMCAIVLAQQKQSTLHLISFIVFATALPVLTWFCEKVQRDEASV